MVRPHEMATATRTDRAGIQRLDSLPNGSAVYVPPQCVGTRRCPLVVSLLRGNPAHVMEWQRAGAEKYGMILLAPAMVEESPNLEEPMVTIWWKAAQENQRSIEAVIQQVLRQFAVDPDKIALVGDCRTGQDALIIGGGDLNVFSRIVVISGGGFPTSLVDPPAAQKPTEFFFTAGILEAWAYGDHLAAARVLRRAGHPVKVVLGFRGHGPQVEVFESMWQWLHGSWTMPTPATRPLPKVVADPMPVLTAKALTRLTAFWASFAKEQDSIRTTARREYLREVAVPVGNERSSAIMVDMSALAARYPSVAADLKQAGLTAKQHDAYRVALLSAQITKNLTVDFSKDSAASAAGIVTTAGMVQGGISPKRIQTFLEDMGSRGCRP